MKNYYLNALVIVFCLCGLFFTQIAIAQTYVINAFAGNGTGGYYGDGGPATAAELHFSEQVWLGNSGNVYIADRYNNCIRKVDASGIITTVAGNGTIGFSGNGGPATAAELYYPTGVAEDASGNIYIADQFNNCVRRVDGSGIITMFAGNGTAGYSGDGGPATAAELRGPLGMDVDASGNIYIVDISNNVIRKVNGSGTITTFAGNGTGGFSGDGGQATAAELKGASGISVDGSGNFYIADEGNNRIRQINTGGIITTIAGNGTYGFSGDGGPATAAEFKAPSGFPAVDASGNIYIADQSNRRVREINSSGIITTIAGNGAIGVSGDGGPAIAAEFISPLGTSVDPTGNFVYIEDDNSNRVRKLTLSSKFMAYISSVTNISCGGDSNGSATVSTVNGTSPYTYKWNTIPVQTNATATGLKAGTYTVIATDAVSDSSTVIVTITQPPALILSVCSTTNVSCYNGNNGCAGVCLSGGTSPYSFSWSDGATATSACNLTAGTYTVTAVDANGCTATTSVTITQPAQLRDSIVNVNNITCSGGNNGSIGLQLCGGTTPYTYTWAPVGGTSATKTGLAAGCYTVFVTDANSCNWDTVICLTQPAALKDSIGTTADSICQGGCVTIFNICGNGPQPYTYIWGFDGATSDSVTVCPFVTTNYTCIATDSAGCSVTATIKVVVCPLPPASIHPAYDSTCVNWTKDSLIGTPPGGVFSGVGVTGNNFNPNIAGIGKHTIMYVYTTTCGCRDTSAISILVDACTGINEVNPLDEQIKLYPNPFSQSVNIDVGVNGPVTITVFNMLGQSVGLWTLDKGHNSIDTQSYPNGVYMLQIKTRDGVLNKKLIKVN